MADPDRSDTSSRNIKAVQELYAAFGKGDVNAILSVLSADVEWKEPENRRVHEVFARGRLAAVTKPISCTL